MASKSEPPVITEKLAPKDAERFQQKLDEAVEYAVAGGRIQERADQARKRARETKSARERAALEREAEELDAEANQQLQTTRRLQSGVWQGLGAGTGIGAGSGMALGTATGVLVGGVLAVPMAGLGGLIGAGTGALHGPWIKLTRGDAGPSLERAEPEEPGAIQLLPEELKALASSAKDQVPKVNGKNLGKQEMETLGSVIPSSGMKKKEASKPPASTRSKRPSKQTAGPSTTSSNSPKPGRKPPKKLEIRSKNGVQNGFEHT